MCNRRASVTLSSIYPLISVPLVRACRLLSVVYSLTMAPRRQGGTLNHSGFSNKRVQQLVIFSGTATHSLVVSSFTSTLMNCLLLMGL